MSGPRCFRVLVAGLSLAAAAGCAAPAAPKWERPKTVRAGGVVRYNGQPLEGAHVTFSNPAANVSAAGLTDAQGRFTLTTFESGDGAVPGKQQVAVSKTQQTGPPVDKSAAPVFRPGGAPPALRWLIPRKYASAATSGLTAEVPEAGTDELVLDLKGPPEK